MNIYGINSAYSAAKASTNGVGGLVTGLDTDELVSAFTATTRAKIAKQVQQKQLLSWRADAYRSVSSKLISIADKYTSFASSTNLLSSAFFKTSTVKANGTNAAGLSVIGSLDKNANLSILSLDSKAVAASYTSNAVMSGTISTGELDFTSVGKQIQTLAGQTVNIKYGGKDYKLEISKDFVYTDAASVAAELNRAIGANEELAGTGEDVESANKIRVSVNEDDGISFSLGEGDGSTLEIVGASGTNTLSALGLKLGAATGDEGEIKGEKIQTEKMVTSLGFNSIIKDRSMTFNYNGVSKTVNFINAPDFTDTVDDEGNVTATAADKFASYLNNELSRLFGSGKVTAAANGNKVEFNTAAGSTTNTLSVTLNGTDMAGENGIMGMAATTSNRAGLGTALSELNLNVKLSSMDTYKISVNGTEIEIGANMTLADMMSKIHNSGAGLTVAYNSTLNRFQVTASEAGSHGRVEITDNEGNLARALFGADAQSVTAGSDAQMTVSYDGGKTTHTITRSSNIFELDGLTLNVSGMKTFTTKNDAGVYSTEDAITFTQTKNTDNIINAVKSMIADYNGLIDYVNTEMKTRYNRDYAPLTDEQRAEMSDKQVEDWEKTAKTGLLYNDTNLRSLASDLRFMFSYGVDGVGSLADIGIKTMYGYSSNGKIELDEDKLRAAIEADPEKVAKMFTTPSANTEKNTLGVDTSAGLMTRLKSVTQKYASTTGATKGILVELAGLENSTYTTITSRLYKQSAEIDKIIDRLNKTLANEQDRYYKKFTALETYTSKMNSISSYLSSFNS